ncbi:MAG: hypothetical protein EAZ51_03395 [Sphingobacteriales bacterium]|nr:MAG: hypothetical protein EAZ64_04765 [Sphingobacteriales bacterium]TAF81877.1 MAG: hypothetical protein EAZ51_03395 [Sphingobacteriales bacterium]
MFTQVINKALITLLFCAVISLNTFAQLASDINNLSLSAQVTQYDTQHYNKVIYRKKVALNTTQALLSLDSSSWMITKNIQTTVNNGYSINLVFKCISGKSPSSAVSLVLGFDDWSVKNYVLMPAALYNGNRVKAIVHPYLSFLMDTQDIGPNKPQVVSDIPRLNIKDGPSGVQQRSGDMSTPAIGFHNPTHNSGFWLLTKQGNGVTDYGIDIEENNQRTHASISITSPVVRENFQYIIADMQAPATDKPANFSAGDSVVLSAKIYFFTSPNVQALYNKFTQIRNDLIPQGKVNYTIPFSAAFKIQEEKFNRQNFEPTFGYYSVGMRENYYQDWQIGWTGGMISPYPLLAIGGQQSRKNVVRNFDWLFPNGISPSGYFWDSGQKGNQWFGIFQDIATAKNLHLVRKSGDGLFYIFKQFATFKALNIPIKTSWNSGAKTVADAFVNTWQKYGQLGQYVHNTTGEIVIGGSASAAIVPATLTLAAQHFNHPPYLEVAKQIAENFNQNYVSKGLIYGAAGDAMQNFDSEATYALLESYITLFEATGDEKWLQIAQNVAIQFSTWVSSYDFVFPPSSTLAKLGKKTTGAVWANTQNKHGAPGICTHSGVALLRLYRATGNIFYLNLLQNIAQAIPQYMSTVKNPIPALQPGWLSERVSTTDWLEGIGEIYPGSTWAETALMLTILELPSIYLNTQSLALANFDQVKSKIVKQTNKTIILQIQNPTTYDCEIKILAENKTKAKLILSNLTKSAFISAKLKAGETKQISISK